MSLTISTDTTTVSLKQNNLTTTNSEGNSANQTSLQSNINKQKKLHQSDVTADNNSSVLNISGASDDSALRSNSFSRKRRWSFNQRAYNENMNKRKRSYSCVMREDNKIALPTKFLLGGTIADPLNLNGLSGSSLANMSPISSPWQASPKSIDVVIPPNITDPLNLNCLDGDISNNFGKRRKRHRHKRKDDISNVSDGQLQVTAPIGVDVSYEVDAESKTKCLSAPITASQIMMLSPQFTPPSRRRRRTMSECAADFVSSKKIDFNKPQTSKVNQTTKEEADMSDKKPAEKTEKDNVSDSANQKQVKKKTYPKFIHGNYNRYYGYRNPSDIEDARLQILQSDWFRSKDILDIGCNVGHLTILLAKNFLPKKIVGLDIDGSLISAARKNIRYYIENKGQGKLSFPSSSNVSFGPIEPPPVGNHSQKSLFPENIAFKQGNYVLQNVHQLNLVKEEYDTILALSITKWIHLNNGDEGIKIFFQRIFRHLRPGGKLILEPQPWASYKKRKNLTPVIHNNFQNIKLKPEQFREYLLAEVGFLKCEVINVANHKTKGFRRPIQVYTKSE